MDPDLHNPQGNARNDFPVVSVVIPAYNASSHIGVTLDSVFRQTFSSYEVLVVNDGSTDTVGLESALQPYLSHIRYFRQENRGPSAARNLAIRAALGRYVALLDSDDRWLPDHLSHQMKHLLGDSALCLVYANNMQMLDGQNVRTAFDSVPQTAPVNLESLLAEQCTVNTSSVVVLRSAVLHAGLFDERLRRCEDFDLWLRLAGLGLRMAFDLEVQVIHRLGKGLSSDHESMKRARLAVFRKAARAMSLTASEKQIVARKIRKLELEIEIEAAKKHLDAGRFTEARTALRRARSLTPSLRWRFAEAAVRYCPRLLRWSYESYLDLLRWYRHRTPASAMGS